MMTADANSARARRDDQESDPAPRNKSTGLFHEPPRALYREMSKAAAFPVDKLPAELAQPINAIVDIVQCAPALAAHGVLGAATLAAQTFADVELPTGDVKPTTCFFMSVAGSGERKTTAGDRAYGGVREYERDRKSKYEFEIEHYLAEHEAWQQARSNAKTRNKKAGRAEIKAAMDAVGKEPNKPIKPMMTSADLTVEGLIKNAAELLPSLGIVTSEGGQFTGGYGLSDDALIRTATALSSMWDGGSARRIRAGDGVSMVECRRLSIDIQCQPDIALEFFGNRRLQDQGLLSRFLPVWPESNVGLREFRTPTVESLNILAAFHRRILSLLSRPWPELEGGNGGLAPRVLKMSAEAQSLWATFSNHCEAQQAEGRPLAHIRPFASKLPEHAGRLAGVIQMIVNPDAYTVEKGAMVSGLALASFYASEYLRIVEAGRVNPDLQLAAKVWDWLSLTWKHAAVSLPDVYQRGPVTAIRDKSRAAQIVAILADHGHLVPLKNGAEIGGQKRRQAWGIYGRHA